MQHDRVGRSVIREPGEEKRDIFSRLLASLLPAAVRAKEKKRRREREREHSRDIDGKTFVGLDFFKSLVPSGGVLLRRNPRLPFLLSLVSGSDRGRCPDFPRRRGEMGRNRMKET